MVINSLDNLGEIQIDQKSAKQFAEQHHIVAFTLLCTKGFSKNSHIHIRCFAPAVGIPEDPFTGSVLGVLAAYEVQNKLLNTKDKIIL